MTRALITGITGFVGSHLADYLLAKTDWKIWGLVRWDDRLDNLEALIPRINAGQRIKLIEGDLNDPSSLDRAVRGSAPGYVFHLAAQSYVQASLVCPSRTIATNTLGTLNLLESLRHHARSDTLIHICSSSEVYGRVAKENLPIREDCPFAPASPYSISKIGTDMLARYYAEAYDLRILTTRMFTHTGPRRGDVFAESSFAKQIAMIEAGQLEPAVKVGNLDSLRTVADVRDAARAYHMLLTVNPVPGEVYNIGGDHTCTVGEILEALFDAAGRRYEVVVDRDRLRPLDADNQVPDCRKFEKHTGWRPEIRFEQTMKDLLEYWRGQVKQGIPLQR